MSKGKHVSPDDPDWVFIEQPSPFPQDGMEVIGCGAPLLALVVGTFVVQLDHGWVNAGLAMGAILLGGYGLYRLLRPPRRPPPPEEPALTLAEFDALRLAADRALAVFRQENPALPNVHWTRLAPAPEGLIVLVSGGAQSHNIDLQRTYVVAADGAITVAPPGRYPSTRYSGAQRRSMTPA